MFLPDKNLMPTVVTHEAFSLGSLIAWLETKEPKQRYDYGCNGHCLIAQYLGAHDVPFKVVIGWGDYVAPDGNTHGTGHHYHSIAITKPWTFGAALDRAREYAGRAK